MSRCVLNIPKNVDFGSSVPDEGALLQQLSAQIQRDVLTVHHTCTHTSEVKKISVFFLFIKKLHVKASSRWMQTSEEAQPFGQNIGGFGLDQDLPAVQSHTGAHLPAHVKHARLLLANKHSVIYTHYH